MKLSRHFAAAVVVATLWAPQSIAQTTSHATNEAAERFDRALRLVNVGDLSGGLAEFQRAYAITPSPVVLFNLGLVYAALHRPVQAAKSLQDALLRVDGLDAADLQRGRSLLAEQIARIGHLAITTSVREGVVEVDNIEVARLPLSGPMPVAAGSHVVGIISAGFAPARREVVVAGRETIATHFDLVAIEGRLAHVAVRTPVPAVTVLVDGERVGTTPLEKTVTVAPGTHRVELKRSGYQGQTRTVTLEDGAQAELSFSPTIDTRALESEGGYLAIRTSETQATISVDGSESELLRGPLHLPRGPHRIRVERGGFVAAERDVVVPLGKSASIEIVFEPNPDTRANYVARADSRRTWSWVTLSAGLVLATGGVVLGAVENGKLPSAKNELKTIERDAERGSGRTCDVLSPHGSDPLAHEAECARKLNSATNRVDDLTLRRTLGWAAAGVGGAIAVTGLVVLVTGNDPHKYDRKATHRFVSNLRLMPVHGARGWFATSSFAF